MLVDLKFIVQCSTIKLSMPLFLYLFYTIQELYQSVDFFFLSWSRETLRLLYLDLIINIFIKKNYLYIHLIYLKILQSNNYKYHFYEIYSRNERICIKVIKVLLLFISLIASIPLYLSIISFTFIFL